MRGSPLRLTAMFAVIWLALLPILRHVASSGNRSTDAAIAAPTEIEKESAWLQLVSTDKPNWIQLQTASEEQIWLATAPELAEEVLIALQQPDERGMAIIVEAEWPDERRRATVIKVQFIESGDTFKHIWWTESQHARATVMLQ